MPLNHYGNNQQLWPDDRERQEQEHPDPPQISQNEMAGLQIAPRGGALPFPEGVIREDVERDQGFNDRFREFNEDRGPWNQYEHDPM